MNPSDGSAKRPISEAAIRGVIDRAILAEAARASELAAAPAAAAVEAEPTEHMERDFYSRTSKLMIMITYSSETGGATSGSIVANRLREKLETAHNNGDSTACARLGNRTEA